MDFKEAYDNTCSSVAKACWTVNVDALKGLIAAGRPVDVKDKCGWFPLHAAAYRQGQPECLEILLQHKDCDVNRKTFAGQTALYLASKIGNIDAIRLLLRHGADVNLTTNEKLSPLWEATEKNHLACMHVLVAAGADVNQQTNTGITLLHSAAERGNTETVTFLLDKEASWGLRHACRVKIVRQLISRGNYTTDSVNTLGLPTKLEDYILYKDFDESDESDDDVDDCRISRISSLGTEMREAFRKLEMVDSTVEMLMAANEKEF